MRAFVVLFHDQGIAYILCTLSMNLNLAFTIKQKSGIFQFPCTATYKRYAQRNQLCIYMV